MGEKPQLALEVRYEDRITIELYTDPAREQFALTIVEKWHEPLEQEGPQITTLSGETRVSAVANQARTALSLAAERMLPAARDARAVRRAVEQCAIEIRRMR